MGTIPKVVAEAYIENYGYHPLFNVNDWWYQRFIRYFIKTGIPEKGIVGILKKHHIAEVWVKQYGDCNAPERIAQNVLKYRHLPKVYDSLATPKIRVTKKRITVYRRNLEDEFRSTYKDVKDLEETVKSECYEATDNDIARLIYSNVSPENWARTVIKFL